MSRRSFLKGFALSHAPIVVGLPPLISMFNSNGTAYATEASFSGKTEAPIEKRFVFWFNGNGIPERYWIPSVPWSAKKTLRSCSNSRTGPSPGVPSQRRSARQERRWMTGSCRRYTGRGPGGPSLDQILARRMDANSRFRSLQIGVSQESFGGAIQKNMSWAGPDRPLPPEEIPHRLFDRLFGASEESWVQRKRSILDAVLQDATQLRKTLPREDELRLEEHLSSIRDLEHAIVSLPPHYQKIPQPEEDFDMKDWPRIAKLQSDMLAYALVTGQTRVASYMLSKCQGLARFPWLGHTAARHHDYTHQDGKAPGETGAEGQRILRDICRWHVEEFAYLVAKLNSIPEGTGTLLDNTVLLFVHEHAEAGVHKNTGGIAVLAGSKDQVVHGSHIKIAGTIGDLYLTVADDLLNAGLGKVPTANRRLTEILA